ncbi:FG-GAP-like repeat-containing protein [Acaryochloris sp. CCMEE 5410]|uniref:FG-GAP-like repeat-containing protein n=1 Tax=Acaryochloris sp. CCMEE 5410 TaxID=310037 RepID=UPI0002484F6E|nr:FG-GAP-like repeat-containing protein [Acaryochloris sp. CCMEE 5410]KAI9129302.1 VCBS repeat-containing protein [Acaryochloris sp. CCMEE 5410]
MSNGQSSSGGIGGGLVPEDGFLGGSLLEEADLLGALPGLTDIIGAGGSQAPSGSGFPNPSLLGLQSPSPLQPPAFPIIPSSGGAGSSSGSNGSPPAQFNSLLSDALTGATQGSLVGNPGVGNFPLSSTSAPGASNATAPGLGFTVKAEGTVTINSNSDFDGDPLDLSDDALIYAGDGFTINGNPILPVQLDEFGQPVLDNSGRPLLVDNAVAVSAGYSIFNANNNSYGNLVPPQIVEEQIVEVPDFNTLKTDTLAAQIPDGTVPISFNPYQNPLNNATDWANHFPPGGTADQPTVVKVTGWGLNVPGGVTIENTIIELTNGYLNFNGNGHQLNNVTFVTHNGGMNLGNIQGTDVTLLSSQGINMNGGARLGGQSLIATGDNQSIQFNGATETTDPTDFLTVISQRDITFNSSANTRGSFLSRGNFSINSTSTIYGSIEAKGNVVFNARATVIGIAPTGPSNTAPTDLALSNTTLSENGAANSVVGQFTTTDPDAGDTFTYTLVPGTGDADNAAFSIVNDQLQINASPDFETQDSYAIRVQSTDQGGLSVEKVFTVNITDVNEQPTQITLSQSAVEENSATGTVVGQLSSLDPDQGDSHTYELVDDAGGRFQIVGDQLQVADGTLIDFETATEYSLTLRSTDAGGLSTTQGLTIQVLDVDDDLQITAALLQDTGAINTDGITADGTIQGTINYPDNVASLKAGLDNTLPIDYEDITSLLQADGSFTLDEAQLSSILGVPLTDGDHILYLQAVDAQGNSTDIVELAFTLDRTRPTVDLLTPLVAGEHSPTARLLGDAQDSVAGVDQIRYDLNGQGFVDITADSTGAFDALLAQTGLAAGAHQLTVEVTDIAGNVTQTQLDFQVNTDLLVGPTASQGWVARSGDAVVLGEQNSFVSEASLAVELGQDTGSRTLSFDLNAFFDGTDAESLPDQVLVYLVDANDPSQTLLDQGVDGTPVFALGEQGAEFQAGLVRFNGSTVEIDVTSVTTPQGLLVFQLINGDSDTGSVIQVSNLTNEVDESGVASPVFPMRRDVAQPGATLDLGGLTASTDLDVVLSKVSLDTDTGRYVADLQIENTGAAIGRQVAVVFDSLPDGVTLLNASGADSNGNPYINLNLAIRPGGLLEGGISDAVQVVFDNPNLLNLDLQPQVLVGGVNQAPVLEAITVPQLMPGEVLKLPLQATDPDGDPITYSLRSEGALPIGILRGDGTLEFRPSPDQIGTYTFTIVASDGALETTQEVTLEVVADPITTTRISGVIANVDQQPLAGVRVEIAGVEGTTAADGSFTLEFVGDLPGDTLKIYPDDINTATEVYPFIAEKLPLVLGHDPYGGVNNVIDRPIYLPVLDIANGQVIDPTQDTTVTTATIPGAAVTVAAGSLLDQQGNPFDGVLSITEVPTEFTPAALPPNLYPDLVVTIQPGDMVFDTPAPLSLPNLAGYAPGELMDLWSINPETGDFDKVGVGQVSADGTVIETIEGGIRNSSWHFFARFVDALDNFFNNPRNKDENCKCKSIGVDVNSEVELHSGALTETHNLVSYQSLGQTRGLTLTYDSLRADPRPIVNFGYNDIRPSGITNAPERLKLVAKLTVSQGDFEYQLPGYQGSEYGLRGGEHIWSLPSTRGDVDAALQLDFRSFSSGLYDYSLQTGLRIFVRDQFSGTSNTYEGQILHVNSVGSVFGNGWGISGLQELVENSDGSVLLIDGNGNEMLFNGPATTGGTYDSPGDDFSTLEKLADGTFRRTLKDQTVYSFNTENQLVSVRDRNGNETRYLYDIEGRITKIIDPVGLETAFTYTNNHVSTITDPAGKQTLLEHDEAGNLIRITDPDGQSRTWGYDAEHHMTSEIDKRGFQEQSFYNFAGRVTGGIRKDGTTVQVDPIQMQGLYRAEQTIDPLAPPQTFVLGRADAAFADGNGNVTTRQLNQVGQSVESFDGEGSIASFERNALNLITQHTDGRNFSNQYTYDDQGNILTIQDTFATGTTEPPQLPPPDSTLFLNPLYKLGSRAQDYVTGDFNDDGFLDIASANNQDNTASVLFGDGLGHFRGPLTLDVGSRPEKIFAHDINQDNRLDLITFNASGLSLLLNTGNEGFSTATSINPLNQDGTVESVSINDINGDGELDLIFSAVVATGGGYGGEVAAFAARTAFAPISALSSSSSTHQLITFIGQGDGSFTSRTEYELTDDVDSLLVMDVDGNGSADIVTANPNNSSVSVLLNNGNGTYNSPSSYSLTLPPYELLQKDLNNDGYVDLVAFNTNGAEERVATLINNGDGTFAAAAYYSGSGLVGAANLADLNNDGFEDLITATRDTNRVEVAFNQGDGTFRAPSSYVFEGAINSLTIGDVNGDNNLDLLAYSFIGSDQFGSAINQLTVFLNDSNGELLSAVSYDDVPFRPFELQDLNQDGSVDILGTSLLRGGEMQVAFGNGDGSFQVRPKPNLPRANEPTGPVASANSIAVGQLDNDGIPDLVYTNYRFNRITVEGIGSLNTGNGPSAIALGDINGDGLDDIAVANAFDNNVSVFLNNGGAFNSPAVQYNVGILPNDLALGDINRDGHLDLLVVNSRDHNISVLENRGDGTFADAVNYATEFSPFSLELGDLNRDGNQDIVVLHRAGGFSVLENQGDGSFQSTLYGANGNSSVNYASSGPAFALGDVNGDLYLDIVKTTSNSVDIWINQADGTFTEGVRDLQVGRNPQAVSLGDFNQDGFLDIVTVNSTDASATVLLGDGQGDFFSQQRQDFAIGGYAGSLVVADLDLDGDLDFATQYFDKNPGTNRIYSSSNPRGFFSSAGTAKLYVAENSPDNLSVTEGGQTQPSNLGKGDFQRFTYDPVFNQLTSVSDELGEQTFYQIDPLTGNRLAERRVVGLAGGDDDIVTRYTYTVNGQIDTITDPLGRITDFDYNNLGLNTRITVAQGTVDEAVIQFEYDAAGNQTAIVDENGNRTELVYDVLNRLTRVIEADPDGAGPLESPITNLSYDETGNLIAMTDPRGNTTQSVYDERDRLVQVTDALNGQTTYEYDAAGNLITLTDELDHTTRYLYDSRNRQIGIINPEGGETQYEYDASNNATAHIDALGNRTQYEYDARNRLVKVIDALGQSSTHSYDAADNLLATIDENGNQTSFQYDDLYRLVQINDAIGGVSSFTYDKASNITTAVDELGRTTQFDYDNRDRRTQVMDPLSGVMSYAYDGVGNLLSMTDELGRSTAYQYDALYRQTSISDPLNFTTRFGYDAIGNLINVTDALGRITQYEYDALNRETTRINALGDTHSYTYDAADNVVAITDELGRTTSFTYDDRDWLAQVTDPLNGVMSYSYDGVGNITSMTDELGRTTRYEYDDLYRQIGITDPLNQTSRFSYDAVGNLLSATDELNRTTTYEYDALYRQTSVSDPLNHTTTFGYDAVDNLVSVTDALGRITRYEYDDLDRETTRFNALGDTHSYTYDAVDNVIAVTDELGRVTTFAYDDRDLRTSVTDALGHTTTTEYDGVRNVTAIIDALGHTTRYGYDALDRQTSETDAIGQVTTYAYDLVGNLLQITDPENNSTSYTYDALDRRITDTNELGDTRRYAFDAVDNLIGMTDRNGRQLEYTYDDLDRQTEEIWLDAAGNPIRTFSYIYDAADQLTAISDLDSAYTYTYDLAGRLITVDNAGTPGVPNVLLTYTYDAVNNMLTVTDTIEGQVSGLEEYTYDALDRVIRLTQSGNGVTEKRVDFAYDVASQMTGSTRYADLAGTQLVAQSDYTFDLAGRLTNLTHSRDSVVIADYRWDYDAANRIIRFTSPDGTSDYNYDDRNQNTGSDHSYQDDEAYSYDNNGNRTNAGYETGGNNRLLSDGTYTYTYDGEGNRITRTEITTGEVTEYTWDYRNRLTGVVTKDSAGNVIQDVEYGYDVYDRRIEKTVDPDGDGPESEQTERFVYDGDHIALVFDENGEQTHRYLHGPQIDQVLAEEIANGEVRWALADNQGTIRDVIDNDGNVLNHVTYDSFGQITSETNPETDFRFGYTGREFDEETGKYFYRARYYDARVGKFISEDPIGFSAGDVNLSRYVFNSPVNFTDPSGNAAFIAIPLGIKLGEVILAGTIIGLSRIAADRELSQDIAEDISDRISGFITQPKPAEPTTTPDVEAKPQTQEPSQNGRPEPENNGNDPEPSGPERNILYDIGRRILDALAWKTAIESWQDFLDPNPDECDEGCVPKVPGRKHHLGGSHSTVSTSNQGGQAHHTPSWAAIEKNGLELSYGRAPTICLTVADHQQTASHNLATDIEEAADPIEYREKQAELIKQGKFKEAQNMDIRNIRRLFGDRYEEGIRQMEIYTEKLMREEPDLFRPR